MRYLYLVVLLVTLAACGPAVEATFPTGDESRTITIVPDEPVYAVTLSVIGARTDDPRCTTEDDAVSCELGDLAGPTAVTVVATDPDDMSCVVFAMLAPGDLSSYRPFTCRVG